MRSEEAILVLCIDITAAVTGMQPLIALLLS